MTTTTTDKLLDAAEFRMRRGGYNAVSFRDLANDTQIKSSSVHYHFPRKEDLCVALVKRYAQRFFDALDAASRTAKTSREKLRAFRSVYRGALRKDDAICLCALLGAEAAALPDPVTEEIRTFFEANITWVARALPADRKPAERKKQAGMIVAAHQGAMILATSLKDPKVFDSITGHLINQA